jgi:hypothetical protein
MMREPSQKKKRKRRGICMINTSMWLIEYAELTVTKAFKHNILL